MSVSRGEWRGAGVLGQRCADYRRGGVGLGRVRQRMSLRPPNSAEPHSLRGGNHRRRRLSFRTRSSSQRPVPGGSMIRRIVRFPSGLR